MTNKRTKLASSFHPSALYISVTYDLMPFPQIWSFQDLSDTVQNYHDNGGVFLFIFFLFFYLQKNKMCDSLDFNFNAPYSNHVIPDLQLRPFSEYLSFLHLIVPTQKLFNGEFRLLSVR